MTKVVIMAVPWDMDRVRRVKDLRAQTGAEVVWDREHSIMDTFTRVLEAVGTDPAIILQDDVYLHPQWGERTQAAIREHPDLLIQFFSIRRSDVGRESYLNGGANYLMNQCYYLPAGMAAELLDFTREWIKDNPGHTGDDTCIADYLKARKLKYWHHVPSLVQHERWKSATGKGRSSNRQSPTFKEQA